MVSETRDLINKALNRNRDASHEVNEYHSRNNVSDDEIKALKEKLNISETRLAKLQDFNNSLFRKLNMTEAESKVILWF